MRAARTAISLAGTLALLALSSGCARAYRPPTANEPHALVKFRRVYEKQPGTTLRELINVEDAVAFAETSQSPAAADPRTSVVLVHPRPAILQLKNIFFHMETRQVMESYTVQVPYTTTETYSCGTYSGGRSSMSTCTRTVTRYRTESKTRLVTKQVEVPDGTCTGEVALSPKANASYLVQLTYQDNGICEASCFEQIANPSAEGAFQNKPCAQLTADELKQIRDR